MAELNIIEKVIALEAVELLKNLKPEQLSRIATIANEIDLPPGKTILEEGKPLEALYVVLDGAVELKQAGGAAAVAKQGDVLGAWALFDTDPMQVNAATVDQSKLLRIGREDFYDLLADNMEITAAIFSILVKRFRALVEQR